MILVLSGADFSENNLGQVEVTTQLDPFTEAAITASGNSSLTDLQKSTLNTFFSNLGALDNTGIWAKMHYVFMPMLASTLAKSMVNYLDNTAYVPDPAKFQMRANGITGATETAYTLDITMSAGIPLNNFSVVSMYNEALDVATTGLVRIGNASNARAAVYMTRNGTGGRNCVGMFNAGSPADVITLGSPITDDSNKNLTGYSKSGADFAFLENDGTFYTGTSTEVSTTSSTTLNMFGNLSAVGITSSNPANALIMIGSSLTQAEMTTIKTNAEMLRDSLLS